MIIYKITNKINNKVYIGQTIQPLIKRWEQHCNKKRGCFALHNAIIKYGAINFTVEQIDVACSREELDQKEIYWIKFYNSLVPNGYNLQTGGNEKHIVSNETRQRMSNSHKGEKSNWLGKHLSEETRRKLSSSHKGKCHSEKTKKIISEKTKGSNNPRARKVQCIETGEIFDCILYAAQKHNCSKKSLSHCVRGVTKTCGKLHWKFINE